MLSKPRVYKVVASDSFAVNPRWRGLVDSSEQHHRAISVADLHTVARRGREK